MTRHAVHLLPRFMPSVLAASLVWGLSPQVTPAADRAHKPPARHVMTLTDIDRQIKALSNWNRWGKDDELGALNLITPRTRRRAARLVKEGVTVSLARVPEEKKAVDNPTPFEQQMPCRVSTRCR